MRCFCFPWSFSRRFRESQVLDRRERIIPKAIRLRGFLSFRCFMMNFIPTNRRLFFYWNRNLSFSWFIIFIQKSLNQFLIPERRQIFIGFISEPESYRDSRLSRNDQEICIKAITITLIFSNDLGRVVMNTLDELLERNFNCIRKRVYPFRHENLVSFELYR